METFGLYLLKSAVWLTGFTLVFLTVLRNERYFQLNRIYLLSGIIASIAFPLYTWHYAVIIPSTTGTISISGITAQVIADQEPKIPFYWWFYAAGLGWLAFRLIWQTAKVIGKLRKTGYETSGPVKLVRTAEYASSFSFFSFVFVNPSTSDVETREIVNHESEHIVQRHWFDLLLVELLCMLQWFNPFVWIYAHLIRQNHEYLADEKALQRTSDPAIYQATLLNQLLGVPVISLANSFSYSLNKKRFKMMKKSIHSPFRKLRLLIVLPLMILVFYAFAKPEYVTLSEELQTDNVGVVNIGQEVKGSTVKGKVVNSDGKPLEGASVVIRNSTTGTISDNEGNFQLKEVPHDAELVLSFVGFETALVKPDFENPMEIKMKKQMVNIDKVTVGSDGTIITSKMVRMKFDPEHSPLYIIDGVITAKEKASEIMAEGVESVTVWKEKEATDKFGEKGKNGVIEMISKKTINKGNEEAIVVGYGTKDHSSVGHSPANFGVRVNDSDKSPLIYIDGKEATKAQMDAIPPETIKSVSVLKDKSATAVYGKAGENGVILIKSKKNKGTLSDQKGTKDIQTEKKPEPFVVVEQMPQFPGGQQLLMKFIGENVKYPAKAAAEKVTGIVVVNFIVSSTGKIENAKIVKSVSPELDSESLRVIGLMPDWEPGKQNGKAVDVAYTIPIQFMLQPKEKKSADNQLPGDPDRQKKEKQTVITDNMPFDAGGIEQVPQFPGGEKAMMKFIIDNLKYPVIAKEKGVMGTVIVNFLVNKEGEITRLKVLRGIGSGCDEEALRIFTIMPKWSPGGFGGKKQDVYYNVPIKFKLDGEGQKEVEEIQKKSGQPFVVVEQMPQYPGGAAALMKFISENVKYPAQATADKAQGTVIMNFVIRSEGKVDQLKVERGVHPALDAEATRVLGLMPDWIPGKQGGKAVDVSYTVPIQFKLQ